jgi:type II secretory ATPase GspE/PulE/Tfp pilus assembly ATPase PilB-like protein
MPRRLPTLLLPSLTILLLSQQSLLAQITLPQITLAQITLAQITLAQITLAQIDPPPGAYLAWYKLLMIAGVFLLWVKTSDWLNRDCMRLSKRTEIVPELWNPIVVGSFLLGFLIVLFFPWFLIGYPLYVLSALVPFLVYFLIRRNAIKAEPELLQVVKPGKGKGAGAGTSTPLLPQDQGAAIEFTPAGIDSSAKQVNLIRARQVAEFPEMKNLLNELLSKRAELISWDYSRNGAVGKFQVDGVWHPLPARELAVADPILASLKYLAGLNPADRRSRQQGDFQVKTPLEKVAATLTTQGIPSGERALLKIHRQRKKALTLPQLGMFPEVLETLKSSLNSPKITIISAASGEGLTSTWQAALLNSGQLTRDCVALIRPGDTESQVENIQQRDYESPEKQLDLLRTVLLTQPDFLAVPKVESPEMMDALVAQVADQNRSVLLQSSSPTAAEALVSVYGQTGESKAKFVQTVRLVLSQRLIRRLCPDCRVEMRVAPEGIKQLGGDPRQQRTLFDHYRLPPPEQRVDEKGRPIEFPPCPTCGGIGYLGRVAVYEVLEVDDGVREVLRQAGTADQIESAALAGGKTTLARNAQKLVLLGVTSIAEIKRVFKK